MNFALSTIALLLGPFVYAWGRKQPVMRQILDGFMLITVAGIVCVHIIPGALAVGGIYVLAFLVAGLAFPVVIERVFHHSHRRAHVFIVMLAAVALILHALIDGIALLPGAGYIPLIVGTIPDEIALTGSLHNHLALGVILHRLPVGMAIWWTVRPVFGAPVALAMFAVIVVATALAFFLGAPVVEWAEGRNIGYFQAFVAGSLVHVVAFGVSHDHDTAGADGTPGWGYRLGILLALFLVFTLPNLH